MWEQLLTPLTGLVENHWWKAFLSLLIPVGQFVWTRYGMPGSDFRKRQLRTRIADLGSQREALNKYSDVPQASQALADLTAEMEACMSQLVAVSRPARTAAATTGDLASQSRGPRRSLVARALLAYVPSGALAWLLHSAFYVNVLLVAMGVLAVVSTPNDIGYGLLGCAFFLIPALIIRHFARRLDKRDLRPTASTLATT